MAAMPRLKRTRRPEARPDEILDAALKVFTDKGFSAARVEDVAKEASLSKGAVYLYFTSKEALFEALVRRFAEQVIAAAVPRFAAMAEADPEAALRNAIRFLVATLSDPALSAPPRLVLAEAERFPAIAEVYRREVLAIGQKTVGGLIEAGVARGQFRAVPRETALKATMGPIVAHMFLTHVFPDPEAPPADPVAVADGLADILLNGLRPRTQTETETDR
jgi:AcrR family transcriptional regulator